MQQNNAVIKQYTIVMEQKNSAMKQKIVALERNKAAFRQNREKNLDFPKINFLDSKPAGSNALSVPFLDTHVQKNGQSRHGNFDGGDGRLQRPLTRISRMGANLKAPEGAKDQWADGNLIYGKTGLSSCHRRLGWCSGHIRTTVCRRSPKWPRPLLNAAVAGVLSAATIKSKKPQFNHGPVKQPAKGFTGQGWTPMHTAFPRPVKWPGLFHRTAFAF